MYFGFVLEEQLDNKERNNGEKYKVVKNWMKESER